jgi:hypothetical protein
MHEDQCENKYNESVQVGLLLRTIAHLSSLTPLQTLLTFS